MSKKRWVLAVPGLLLLAAFARHVGGWAVISVQDLPDYAVAGQPITLTYAVRQHGVELLSGLKGSVVATSGSAKVNVDAKGTEKLGHYAATLTLPNAGEWKLSIESGFRTSKLSSIPMRVVVAGGPAAPTLAPEEKGRRLFVAKGCVTCHTHSDSKAEIGNGAPELTGKKFAPSYLAEFLANPSIKPPARKDAWIMPNLQLKQREIAALVAFINSEKRVAVAQ
jgi:mono/diheme cytochrome c family protein